MPSISPGLAGISASVQLSTRMKSISTRISTYRHLSFSLFAATCFAFDVNCFHWKSSLHKHSSISQSTFQKQKNCIVHRNKAHQAARIDVTDPYHEPGVSLDRRNWIFSLISSNTAAASVLLFNDSKRNAANAMYSSSGKGALSASDIAKRLHVVPTFTIVDKTGVPYFVFGEDAKLTSYFFTTYEEADRILSVAKQSSDKVIADSIAEMKEKIKEKNNGKLTKKDEKAIINEVGSNPWNEARISTIPLDTAVTLASVVSSSRAGGVHFQVAPSKDDIEEAMALEKLEELAEGKVPIFYFENFDVPLKSLQLKLPIQDEDALVTPVYFQKTQLISEWKRQHPKRDVPQVKTSDLFATLTEMIQPTKSNRSKKDEEELQRLLFIPPLTSEQKAKECKGKGGNEEPYKLGERIVVL